MGDSAILTFVGAACLVALMLWPPSWSVKMIHLLQHGLRIGQALVLFFTIVLGQIEFRLYNACTKFFTLTCVWAGLNSICVYYEDFGLSAPDTALACGFLFTIGFIIGGGVTSIFTLMLPTLQDNVSCCSQFDFTWASLIGAMTLVICSPMDIGYYFCIIADSRKNHQHRPMQTANEGSFADYHPRFCRYLL